MSYRRVFQLALVALAGMLVACSADQTNPTAPDVSSFTSLSAEANGGRGGNGGNGDIDTCDTYDTGAVSGDGGPYCNSQSRVTSFISDGAHPLGTVRSGRMLNFDFSGGCVDGPCTLPDAFNGSEQFSAEVSMGSWLNSGTLMGMTVGQTIPNGMVVRFEFDIKKKDQVEVGYGYTPGFAAACPANAPITVTRTTGETWVFETDSSARACVIEDFGSNNKILHGIYTMPLRYTVTVEQ